MTVRTKYKLGERVLFTNDEGFETLATVTSISTEYTTNGVTTIYRSNHVQFSENQIIGKVTVTKPGKPRGRKKSLNTNSHTSTGVTPGATHVSNHSMANGVA